MMTSVLRVELLPQFPWESAARHTVPQYSHLSSPLSCYLSSPSFCCIHYNLVIYVEENMGGGTSLPQPSLRIPRLAAAFLSLHLVLVSLVKIHQCSQEIPSEPSSFQHAPQTRFVYPWIQSGLHPLFLSFRCSFWLLSLPFLVIRHIFLDTHDYLRCVCRGSSSPKTSFHLP